MGLSGQKTSRRGPVWKGLVLLLCAAAVTLHAQDWAPSGPLLDIIRHLESADGLFTVGDNGRSLGPYQLSKAAWLDVNAWRKAHNLAVLDYTENVWSETVSRGYAADYLRILHARLAKNLDRSPSSAELYAAYNMGVACFARCQYSLPRVNSTTAAKCRQVEAFMRGEPTFVHRPEIAKDDSPVRKSEG